MRDRRPGGGRRPASPRPPQQPSQEHADLRYPIPAASAAAWRAWATGKGPCNPGLLFDRFAPDWGARERTDATGGDQRSRARQPSAGDIKKSGLEQVVRAMARCDTNLLVAWRTRWQAIAAAVGATPFTLRSDWRLVTGLGRHGPLEVGFRFDRYGFPILPGGGLKGLARTAALVEIAGRFGDAALGRLQQAVAAAARRESERGPLGALEHALAVWAPATKGAEPRDLKDPAWWQRWLAERVGEAVDAETGRLAADFHAVFGTVGAAGGAVFLDAIPAEAPRLELDIMNPHYPQYYQSNGKTPPTDWQSPVPVYFLTVAPQTAFWFAVGWRGPEDSAGGARRRAEAWLRWGLMELGAGAKTSAGYGYFLDKPAQAERATAGSAGRQVPATGQPRGPVAASASQAPQRAAPATPAPPPQPALPRVTRRGTIARIRPDQRRGWVRDDETGQEYRFGIEVVKGNTPANKSQVEFDLEGDRVVRVQRV